MGTSVEAMTRHYEDSVRTIETAHPSCPFIAELRAELDALGLATVPAAPLLRNDAHGKAPGRRPVRTGAPRRRLGVAFEAKSAPERELFCCRGRSAGRASAAASA